MKKQEYRRGRKGRKRRMTKFELGEISIVDTPAQEAALIDIQKASTDDLLDDNIFDKQEGPRRGETFREFLTRMREEDPDMDEDRARRMFDRGMNKAGDLADLLTSEEEGHQHAVYVRYHDRMDDEDRKKLLVVVDYAGGGDQSSVHDHKVIMNDGGEYVLSENHGHTHTVDQDMMRRLVMEMTFGKQTAEERREAADRGQALPDGSFPIRNTRDLRNAISAFGRANREDRRTVARHIRRRARALNATEMLPEEGVLADLLKNDGEDNIEKESQHMDEDLKEANEQIDTLSATVATLEKVAAMSGDHKAFYDKLEKDAKEAFLEKSDAERAADIRKATEDDPVIYTATDGSEYRKSDDARLVKMAMDRDEDRKKADELAKQLADADLTKRAEQELSHLSGDLDVRKALMKQIDGIEDEALRKKALDSLRSKAPDMSYATKNLGVAAEPSKDDPQAQLEKMAADIAAKENIPQAQAFMKALETEAGQALYEKRAKH